MRMYIWLALLIAAVTYVIVGLATLDRSSNDAQIRSMIGRTVSSIQKRDLGGTILCVSKSYKDSSGTNYDRLRLLAAQALRVEREYTARAQIKRIDVHANTATVYLHVSVTAVDGGPIYSRNLTLRLAKEDGRHALLIPVKVWRVVSVDGLAIDMQDEL
ncbi:MAG: hypothetical protein ABFD49_00450 [Armatimonadota bacterium]|nr:hypothetical protein [bacterium]